MAETICARCGHDAWHLEPYIGKPSGCVEDDCHCRHYRTKAQEVALLTARLSLGPAVTEVKASVVKQLLEAFE